jgi:hypothetical protein
LALDPEVLHEGDKWMYTSLFLAALFGLNLSNDAADGPFWLKDYPVAQQQAASKRKPIAVFIGSGKTGFLRLAKEDELNPNVRSLLTEKYICVYVDTQIADGRQLAADFNMSSGLGLVISDRTGKVQAFRHEGNLAARMLEQYLERYADPDRIVRTTETNPTERASYYGSPQQTTQAYYGNQGGFAPSFGACSH